MLVLKLRPFSNSNSRNALDISRVVLVSFVTSVSVLYQLGAGKALTPGIYEVKGKDPSGFW
jgi:hypothetical protein